MNCRLPWIGLLGVLMLAWLSIPGEERPAGSLWDEIYQTAWRGIYTSDQAARGEAAYRARCAACHGPALEGTDDGPSLAGRDFRDDWNNANIADLFEKIQYTMPANRSARLSDKQIADVLAYILQFNGFPPGTSRLPPSVDDLRGVRFVAANPGR